MVDPLARGLLGRHVGERADDVAGARERLVAGEVGDAEVGELGDAARPSGRVGDEHVLRLDVAVHDAALVRVLERVAEREPDRAARRGRSAAPSALELVERAARRPARTPGSARCSSWPASKMRDDPGVVEPAGGERLALGARRVAAAAGGDAP